MIRLTHLLFDIPKKSTEVNRLFLKYSLCRNALEIPTILLPHEGYLIASYKARVRFLHENFSKLKSRRYFPNSFPNFLENCLKGKLNLVFPDPLEDLYRSVLESYVILIKFIGNIKKSCSLSELIQYLFDIKIPLIPRLLRQRVYETLYATRYFTVKGFKRHSIKRWISNHFRGLIIAFLLCMHYAMWEYMVGIDPCEKSSKAYRLLQSLLLKDFTFNDSDSFEVKWYQMRALYLSFLKDFDFFLGRSLK